MRSHLLRFAAAVGAATLSVIAAAPAIAAAPLAQAGANAVTLSIAGNANGSGDVTATDDGSGEQTTGETSPQIGVLGGSQNLIRTGVLAQEATADAASGSAACAGLAGTGGSVVRIGETKCLSGGDGSLSLSIANLDLSDTELINSDSALGQVDTTPISTVLGDVTSQLADGVADANADLANLGLGASLDAISAHCTASLGSASGDSDFAGVTVSLNVPGRDAVVLQELDVHYPPNTDVFINVDDAVNAILDAVEENIRTSLDGAFAPLEEAVFGPVREQIVDAVLAQVGEQLAPLSQNVLKLTLNRQIKPSPDAIKVRALDLTVLPAATEQLGAELVNLQIGNAACGPNGRVGAVARPQPADPTALPTAVSAGVATAPGISRPQGDDHTNAIVLGAFAVLVATGAGFVGFRRLRG
ncbi:MAG: hypothetical protein ACXWXO_14920 [Nocardioides sp.]